MTPNPINKIEERKAQEDMGIMAVRVYRGAVSEATNRWEAFLATVAFFSGMFHGPDIEEEGDDAS